jgi:hypothetical protein
MGVRTPRSEVASQPAQHLWELGFRVVGSCLLDSQPKVLSRDTHYVKITSQSRHGAGSVADCSGSAIKRLGDAEAMLLESDIT